METTHWEVRNFLPKLRRRWGEESQEASQGVPRARQIFRKTWSVPYCSGSYFERNGFKALDGKCGSNCFDGVYIKGDQVIVNEVKPLQANGSIKLSPRNPDTGLPTQMTDSWIKTRTDQLLKSGDPAKIQTGNLILQASRSGNLTTLVSGVNSNGMVIMKVKP